MVDPTLYDILGESPLASSEEIKRAWRDAAERFEPGSGGSSAQFRMFNEAAEVLLDPVRRKAYDEKLAAQEPVAQESVAQESAAQEPAAQKSAAPGSFAQAPASAPPGATDSPARRGLSVTVLAVVGLLASLTMGAAIYLGVQYQRATTYEQALDRAPAAAERAATAVLSYDHESLDADRDAAAKFLTPGYKAEYVKTFNSLVQESATQTKAKVEAEVLASSAMLQTGDREPARIPVLLFVNQTTVSTANSGEPSLALNRVRLDMVNVDGTWLVGGITSY